MWLANCAHYDVSIPAADNRELWRRIMDRDYPVGALVCGASVGEVRSSALRTTCFVRTHSVLGWFANLKDLWVEPSARGAGWVRKLIDASVARRRDLGWRRIYWHTETDNLPARRLYKQCSRLTDYVATTSPSPCRDAAVASSGCRARAAGRYKLLKNLMKTSRPAILCSAP